MIGDLGEFIQVYVRNQRSDKIPQIQFHSIRLPGLGVPRDLRSHLADPDDYRRLFALYSQDILLTRTDDIAALQSLMERHQRLALTCFERDPPSSLAGGKTWSEPGTIPIPRSIHDHPEPAYIALAEFRPGAQQPLWFSESKELMDIGEAGLGPQDRRDIGVYSSFTTRQGNNVLWHPDRKFFLLGKRITDQFQSDLTVPKA